jgi:hypothetical protein
MKRSNCYVRLYRLVLLLFTLDTFMHCHYLIATKYHVNLRVIPMQSNDFLYMETTVGEAFPYDFYQFLHILFSAGTELYAT